MMDFKILAERLASNSPAELSSEEFIKFRVERANSLPGNLEGYDCKKCLNRGYTMRIDENGYEVATPCACLKARAAKRAASRSGLGSAVDRLTLESFQTPHEWQKKLKAAAERFVRDPMDCWFYVGGNPGSGKTHICTAICGEFLKQGKEVRYFVWPSDIRRLKSMANDGEYDNVFRDFAEAEVLYIDDLFKARSTADLTAADIARTFELINRRDLEWDKITVFSSELDLQQVVRVDEATGSRIVGRCGAFMYDLGKDPARNWRLFKGGSRG